MVICRYPSRRQKYQCPLKYICLIVYYKGLLKDLDYCGFVWYYSVESIQGWFKNVLLYSSSDHSHTSCRLYPIPSSNRISWDSFVYLRKSSSGCDTLEYTSIKNLVADTLIEALIWKTFHGFSFLIIRWTHIIL